ncbi:MAG: hypothetical protein ACFFCJ_04045 [Promethearchaeota archaeon]
MPTDVYYEKERISFDPLTTTKRDQTWSKWIAKHWKKFVIMGGAILVLWIIWLLFFSGLPWGWIPESEYTGPGLAGIISNIFAIIGGALIGLGLGGKRLAKKMKQT